MSILFEKYYFSYHKKITATGVRKPEARRRSVARTHSPLIDPLIHFRENQSHFRESDFRAPHTAHARTAAVAFLFLVVRGRW